MAVAPAPRPKARSTVRRGRGEGAELRILRVLVAHGRPATMRQWATLAGLSAKGGTWSTYVSRLRSSGYLGAGVGENAAAAQRVADRLRATGDALGEMATGRPGRVAGTYEKSVTGLRYIIAYTLTRRGDREILSILRVIHTARDWPEDEWLR